MRFFYLRQQNVFKMHKNLTYPLRFGMKLNLTDSEERGTTQRCFLKIKNVYQEIL